MAQMSGATDQDEDMAFVPSVRFFDGHGRPFESVGEYAEGLDNYSLAEEVLKGCERPNRTAADSVLTKELIHRFKRAIRKGQP